MGRCISIVVAGLLYFTCDSHAACGYYYDYSPPSPPPPPYDYSYCASWYKPDANDGPAYMALISEDGSCKHGHTSTTAAFGEVCNDLGTSEYEHMCRCISLEELVNNKEAAFDLPEGYPYSRDKLKIKRYKQKMLKRFGQVIMAITMLFSLITIIQSLRFSGNDDPTLQISDVTEILHGMLALSFVSSLVALIILACAYFSVDIFGYWAGCATTDYDSSAVDHVGHALGLVQAETWLSLEDMAAADAADQAFKDTIDDANNDEFGKLIGAQYGFLLFSVLIVFAVIQKQAAFLGSSHHNVPHYKAATASSGGGGGGASRRAIPPKATFFSNKKACKYGASCYQTNPGHLQQFSHPKGFNPPAAYGI